MLDDPRVAWLPIRHHSPACAVQVERVLRRRHPAVVLIEGPEEATPHLPWLVHPAAAPPLTVLLAYTDPTTEPPSRVRLTWPLLACDPEWVAMRVGTELGAEVRLIDPPPRALPRGPPVSGDRALAESAYFQALASRSRRTTFDGWWDATFEPASSDEPDGFFRAILTFAWCARHLGDSYGAVPEATLARERHFRAHLDQALAEHPGRSVAVVTGAFHAVGLPATSPKRLRAKADKHASVLLSVSSSRTVAALGVATPGWATARHQALVDGRSIRWAAERALVEIARAARASGRAIGTADAVGAVTVALGLSELRGGRGLATEDLLDAARAAFGKQDADAVVQIAERVLVGDARGALPDEAGRPPLVEDFYAELRAHRIELGPDVREVRCDPDKQERHRAKSAFFHRCRWLGLPMFGELPDGSGESYRGPDWVNRADLHLSLERWGVVRGDELDEQLWATADLGPTIEAAAANTLDRARADSAGDAEASARLLLEGARTRLLDRLPALFDQVADAVAVDGSFGRLVAALVDLVALKRYRDALPTQGNAALDPLVEATWQRACLRIPTLASVDDLRAVEQLDQLAALVRFALAEGEEVAPRDTLVERLSALVSDTGAHPLIRGGANGIRCSLGQTTPRAVAVELAAYLRGPLVEVRRGGAFLEGLLRTSRSTFVASPHLLDAVHQVVATLPDEAFAGVLPDLRRAFSVFVPAELERIGAAVARRLTGHEPSAEDALSAAAAALARAVERRVSSSVPE